jgi:hypothetical protein
MDRQTYCTNDQHEILLFASSHATRTTRVRRSVNRDVTWIAKVQYDYDVRKECRMQSKRRRDDVSSSSPFAFYHHHHGCRHKTNTLVTVTTYCTFTMFTTRLTVQAARSNISISTSLRLNAASLRSFTSTTPVGSDQYDVVIIGTYLL